MELKSATYSDKIKLYYNEVPNRSLATKVIKHLWFQQQNSAEDFELVKANRSGNEVYKMKFQNETYYLKSYFHRKWKKRVKNFFREVEAIKLFNMANKLLAADLQVVKPVLALTYKRSIFLVDSIFVTKEKKGETLDDFILSSDFNQKVKNKIINILAQIWIKLLNNNFLHQDPALENFLLTFKKNNPQLVMVDFDHIYDFPILPQKVILDSLARFCAYTAVTLTEKNIKCLSRQEKDMFLKKLYSGFNFKTNYHTLVSKLNIRTINKLEKWGDEDIIYQDHSLADFYKNM